MSFTATMEDTIVVAATRSPLKRPLPDDVTPNASPASCHIMQSVEQSAGFPTPPLTTSPGDGQQEDTHRTASPAPSSSALSSVAPSTADGVHGISAQNTPGSATQPPKKRRKLTVVEKEEQRRAKELREAEKAEKKVQREREQAVKDEEKRVKAEERRTRNEEKDAKKREVEVKKQQKVEEEVKKERSQLRLQSFFAKPKTTTKAAPVLTKPAAAEACPNLALETYDEIESRRTQPESPGQKATPTLPSARSFYSVFFLPFNKPSHTTLAPYLRALSDAESSDAAQVSFDDKLGDASHPFPPSHNLLPKTSRSSRGLYQPKVSEIIETLQGESSQHPIDLTDADGKSEQFRPQDLLDAVIIRHLHFAEDVRPPYSGSYTRTFSPRQKSKLMRNPFSRTRDDTDYDYDSEAEWEEPEEGEDIQSEGEDDAESLGDADEMDGFLDDENDEVRARAKHMAGELSPISTGMCWESSNERSPTDLRHMKLDWLIDVPTESINPFSTTYWSSPSKTRPAVDQTHPQTESGLMQPPRLPLTPRTNSSNETVIVGAATGMKGPIMAIKPQKPAKAPKPITAKLAAPKLVGPELEQFRDAVDGSNLTKIELLKSLKERFPKVTNETLKETLGSYFARLGASAADKRWRLVTT